jgi:hypothetical protein
VREHSVARDVHFHFAGAAAEQFFVLDFSLFWPEFLTDFTVLLVLPLGVAA